MNGFARTNAELVRALADCGVLRSAAIRSALMAVDRQDFVLNAYRSRAYEDTALPIPGGQTISQPYTVVFMLELLGAQAGETVYDVGSGSGWQTALLAHIVADRGWVYAAEVVPEVCAFGQANMAKYPELVRRVVFACADAASPDRDIPDELDRIIVAADIGAIPGWWRKRLRVGGTLVYPSGGVMHFERKIASDKYETEEFPGFAFVPFVHEGK